MAQGLYLLNYNNYFNRLLKYEETLENYLPYTTYNIPNVNFKPNDNIDTVITNIVYDESVPSPDYAIVYDMSTSAIVSRWFVADAVRLGSGAWNLSLHRDVVVDYFNIIKTAPAFIEKALVKDTDSAIFNSEDMTFNQIKTKETAIKDATKLSWIVAYIAREKADGSETALQNTFTPKEIANITTARDTWEFKDYINGVKELAYNPNSFNLNFNFYYKKGLGGAAKYLQVILNKQNQASEPTSNFNRDTQTNYIASPAGDYTNEQFNNEFASTYNEILNYIPTAAAIDLAANSTYIEFKNLNNTTIKFTGDDTLYQIKINETVKTYNSPTTGTVGSGDLMYQKVQSLWSSVLTYSNPQSAIATGRFYNFSFGYTALTMTLVPLADVSGSTISYNIPVNRVHLSDAPYDMICAPFEDTQIKLSEGNIITSSSRNILEVFNNMAIKFAGEAGMLYDIQRLPYCPIDNLSTSNNVLNATLYNDETQRFEIKQGDTTIGVVFACEKSNFSKSILLDEPIVINNVKIQSMCDVYRLCSPNYNGVFEFDAAMNGGVDSFNVYCTYKPFNPYIQVSPNFGRFYGKNFDDARGLICGGEWSLPIVTSAWETYERQNANYNNIFNRQIENMKTVRGYQRSQEITAAIVGALGGAAGGAGIGTMMSGGLGKASLWGGVGTGLLSASAGVADVIISEKLYKENLDYTKDQFGYQLGNIQALPMSLSRVSAFTVNNKVFPFLEYYTCSEEEKIALANKIAYNGMTVMRVGKIKDYIGNTWSYNDITAKNYIKGRIIKLDIEDDTHVANVINTEFNLGFFIQGG